MVSQIFVVLDNWNSYSSGQSSLENLKGTTTQIQYVWKSEGVEGNYVEIETNFELWNIYRITKKDLLIYANFIIIYDIVTRDVSVFNICLFIFLIKTEIFYY